MTAVGIVMLVALIALAIPLIIGVIVYKDANQRVDCNPWLWALIAALAPSFVGVIIYVIIRNDYPLKPEATQYDEFGNSVPKKKALFPTWAKVLLIVLLILFVVLLVGGCVAAVVGIIDHELNYLDSFYYSF